MGECFELTPSESWDRETGFFGTVVVSEPGRDPGPWGFCARFCRNTDIAY